MKNGTVRGLPIVGSLLACMAAPLLAFAQSPAAQMTPADAAAYTFGLNMGEQLHQIGVTDELSITRVTDGLKDGLAGKKASPVDQEQLQAFLHSVVDAVSAKNAATAKTFLQQNGKQKDVTTTASGLQYRIVAAGDTSAASPQPTDRVTVRYRGTLIDGTEFDSSSRHAGAAPIAVNNTIKGWQEALSLMKPGAKWELFLPPELAYGQAARAGIPGGSLLIFELELMSVQPSPVPRAQ
jgi:FKBP-type peptidyl-prolyl cis-trans isomerase FklB